MSDDAAVVPLEDVQVDNRLDYVERPMMILDWKTKSLRNKVVSLVKVKWQHRRGSARTWEPESGMRENYPHLLTADDFEDEV